ncbi:hypothetical protein G6F59_018529 [Rhizopus arrhizus]|nr:hypothetical protein G6F59_018529 [Rhizopus arrhizus]
MGSPCKRPSGWPAAWRSSAWVARASAPSASTVTTAFTWALQASMRARCAAVTSRALRWPAAISARSATAVMSHIEEVFVIAA